MPKYPKTYEQGAFNKGSRQKETMSFHRSSLQTKKGVHALPYKISGIFKELFPCNNTGTCLKYAQNIEVLYINGRNLSDTSVFSSSLNAIVTAKA
jgi:hypothetical protein